MVQLSVNVDGKDQVKKPCEDTKVPIPEKPGVRVRRGRRCSKVAIGITIVTILVLLAVGAALLGVFLRRHHKSWKDCFNWEKGHDSEEWNSGGNSDSSSSESNSGEHGHGHGHGHDGPGDGDGHGGPGDGDGHGGPGDGDGHGGPGDGDGHGGPGDGHGHGGPGDGDHHDGGHTE